jgi:hypothetical protein
VEGPPGASAQIRSPREAVTEVTFQELGSYTFELTVDDGAELDSTASARIAVSVLGEGGAAEFRRGDVDGDGRVNLTDAVRTLNYLFQGTTELECLDAADTNDSAAVNITDPIATLGFLFLGAPAPAPPGPSDCGQDPTGDDLPACESVCRR